MIQNRNSQSFRQIHLGDAVWIRNYANGPKWLMGTVIAKNGPVSFEVDVKGHVLRRHLDQIRYRVPDLDRESIDNSHGEPFMLRKPEGDSSKRDIEIQRDLEIQRGTESQIIPDIQSNEETQKDREDRHYQDQQRNYQNDEPVQFRCENETVNVPEGPARPQRQRRVPTYLKDYELNTKGVK